ncbi:MAG: hypothetical protein ABIG93_03350 [archaeon]|nr:hypothetical protein [Nanoarchaeota archaeon]
MSGLRTLAILLSGMAAGAGILALPLLKERTDRQSLEQALADKETELQEQYNYTSAGRDGFHSRESPIVGIYMQENKEFQEFVPQNHALMRLHKALYLGDERFAFIPEEYAEKARWHALLVLRDYLDEYRRDYDLFEGNAVKLCYNCRSKVWEVTEPTWHVRATVSANDRFVELDGVKYIALKEVTTIHELEHVKRASEDDDIDTCLWEYGSAITELPSTLMEIIVQHQIAEDIGIAPSNAQLTTDYRTLTINELAEKMEELVGKYETVEKALMSPEGISFVSQYWSNEKIDSPHRYVWDIDEIGNPVEE